MGDIDVKFAPRSRLLISGVSCVAAFACGTLVQVVRTLPASAAFTNPPPYSVSIYVTKSDTNASMESYGDAAGKLDQPGGPWGCASVTVFLDFGRPTRGTYEAKYQGYGTDLAGTTAEYRSDPTIETMADYWAIGWYFASPCGTAAIAISTNNSDECNGGMNGCNVLYAGTYWASLTANIESYCAYIGLFNVRINAQAGDDIETGYDTFATTDNFIIGFSTTDFGGERLYDFGDPFYGYQDWTVQDIYDVSAGFTYSWGFEQSYTSAFDQDWGIVNSSYPDVAVRARGAMSTSIGYSPTLAWEGLSDTFGEALLYNTYISFY